MALICLAFVSGHSCVLVAQEPESSEPATPVFNATLDEFEYPYDVKRFEFEAQGQRLSMAYMDVQPQGEIAKTIVLLHGKNFSGFYYHSLAERLLGLGYRVVIIDQIGFGKSTKPQSFQFSLQALAHHTDQLLSSIGVESFSLLGHSMGGMLATRYSLMFPDKVQKLFLIAPIGLEDWKRMTSYKAVDDLYAMELASTREQAKEYQRQAYYGGEWSDEYDKLLVPLTGWLNGPDRKLLAWNAALTSEMLMTQPVCYEFELLKPQTVLVIGMKDRTAIGKAWAPTEVRPLMGNYPELGQRVSEQIPNCTLIELDTYGHLPFFENEQGFWDAIKSQF